MPRSSNSRFHLTRAWRPTLALTFFATLAILTLTHRLHWILLAAYALASVVSFTLYAIDKSKARQNKWRTPEATLLAADLLCGWPGGLLAQNFLRHKNQKASYQIKFWLLAVINTLLLCLWIWPSTISGLIKNIGS